MENYPINQNSHGFTVYSTSYMYESMMLHGQGDKLARDIFDKWVRSLKIYRHYSFSFDESYNMGLALTVLGEFGEEDVLFEPNEHFRGKVSGGVYP